jgi:hypothetical protein
VEDQVGAVAVIEEPAPRARLRPAAGAEEAWIVSPAFDLLFIANVGWPLLWLPGMASRTETAFDFWQVYFLTLPHRWITLILVAADPDRRDGRGRLLLGIALAFMLLILGVRYGTAAFTCLALVDYVWNAWHFAAQHSGVLRIYGRKAGTGWEPLDRHGVRLFVTYTILRTASWTTGWIDDSAAAAAWLHATDLAVLIVPAALAGLEIWRASTVRTGRAAYVVSFCALYSSLLLSLSLDWAPGVIAMTTPSGMFHAVEYLAVVSHYAQRRRELGSAGAFPRMARVWPVLLGTYAVVLGSAAVWVEGAPEPMFEIWQGLNLWAATVHYAFDGMIWKLRRPETARVLGARAAAAA